MEFRTPQPAALLGSCSTLLRRRSHPCDRSARYANCDNAAATPANLDGLRFCSGWHWSHRRIGITRITRRLGSSRTIFSGAVALTVATLLLPLLTLLMRTLQPTTWNSNPLLLIAIALCMLAAGTALALINVPAQTTIQELTPDWIKGRVLALQLVLYNACAIPVILFIGATSDLFGIDRVLYLLSACEIAFGLWGLYYERRDRDHTPAEEVEKASTPTEPDKIAPHSPSAM